MDAYDIIIVGAGLAGLYTAYNIKKRHPDKSFIILESNRRNYIGGRIGNELFYGEEIVVGAGVGRQDTDELLIKLLDELKIKYQEFKVNMHYSKEIKNVVDIKHYLNILRKAYKPQYSSYTFKKYGIKILGKKLYDDFVISSGYSDYENEDTYEVLYHYQMEDNSPGWTALHINWSVLVRKLCDVIGMKNIKTSTKIEYVEKLDNCLIEVGIQNKRLYGKQVIVATRISTIQKLFPSKSIYNEIVGQPFIYIYAKFDKKSSEIMKEIVSTYTIVPGPLQKMIPFSESVYMIAYADNKNAELLSKHKENTLENRIYFENELEKALGLIHGILKIIAIKDYYWPIGTHYYKPLTKGHKLRPNFIREAQHPDKDDCILVVGEAVSRRQGWTEGALESVHAVLKYIN